jgi:eukaryotic-like serine/threonine-protein kinase
MPPTPCLTDELLAELMDGSLGSEALERAHAHAAECDPCRRLLATVALLGSSHGEDSSSRGAEPESALRPAEASWEPPTEFDEFRLQERLGRGAMGVVYLAEDRWLERRVAVKFIAAPQPDARARARFLIEVRAIARLQHPNVVTLFRVGEVQGHPYLVSEYLQGQSLAELPLPLPWRRALRLGLGLARGLAAAHRQRVLHRDIKPSNVFLTTAGEVKLLDFGLAEFAESSAPPAPTATRALVGTPRYMAPELFRGESSTPRSDLYALGLVLYELCTGKLPPRARGESPEASQLPPLNERVPGMDPEFASLMDRCLRLPPAERFASAEALCEALERLTLQHEPSALGAGNPYRGLSAFEAEHRALFFGREEDIRAVLERLRRQPLVLVAGDSGVGKSSLCRAGLLPRVAQGVLDEYRDYTPLTLWPGRRPLAALASALAPVLGATEAELARQLAESPSQLGPALRAAHQESRGLLLFVDQLEELLTLSEPFEAALFSRLLGELALPTPGVRVLLTVRGDFLTRLSALPGLGGEVERALYLLRPLTPEALREAITGPARSRGVTFESEALIQDLLESVAYGAGSLPLLQFTLAELWERRDSAEGRITRAALEETGGAAGALSRHADSVLERLGPTERQAACRMLLQLVTAEDTRGRLSEEELAGDLAEARAALRALVEGRLLHARTTGHYEIAHEALIESWGTLRRLREEDAGQRALRQRLEAASAEWERMGRSEEQLWRVRQLEEARVLEASRLGPREQTFLQASQRAMRRQRLWRAGAVLLLGLIAAAAYGVPRLQAYWETQAFVRTRLEDARRAMADGSRFTESASQLREEALTLFDGEVPPGLKPPPPPKERWAKAEETWIAALNALDQAESDHDQAEQLLEAALERVPGHVEVRKLLADLTLERIRLAERFHRKGERARLLRRFERLAADNEELRKRLEVPAELQVETEPAGATVELWRYVEEQGARQRKPVPGLTSLGMTPTATVQLPAGSYHLRLRLEGHVPVDLPLVLERGAQERVHLVLPTSVPEGYVYVPPGCFLMGSDDPEDVRDFLHSTPLHRMCMREGYLIGRHEVTVGDWLEYLKTLPEGAAARRVLEEPSFGGPGAVELERLPSGVWSYWLRRVSGSVHQASEGEPFCYPSRPGQPCMDWRRFPLTGVSVKDLNGYLAWLDSTGRLPGARLCGEREWERAARGADGRKYPHGDRLQPAEANFDATYSRQDESFGPDAVGAHPESASPFDLLDMAGNAYEATRAHTPDLGEIVLRGGAWYYERVTTRAANRVPGTRTLRDATVGVRLCAPAK